MHYLGLGEEEGFVGRMKGLAVHVFFETSSAAQRPGGAALYRKRLVTS